MLPRQRHITITLAALAFASLISCRYLAKRHYPDPAHAISWDKASQYIGKDVTIWGPVVAITYDTHSRIGTTFISLGLNYPDPHGFTVIIWEEDIGKFHFNPDSPYDGKTLYVRGVVKDHNGSPQIVVTYPEQIDIR